MSKVQTTAAAAATTTTPAPAKTIKLNLKPNGKYLKRETGKLVYRYIVTGSEEDVAIYVAKTVAEGANQAAINTDDGVILYSPKFLPVGTTLEQRADGKFFANKGKWEDVSNLQQQGYSFEAACAMAGVTIGRAAAPATVPAPEQN